MSLGMTVTCLHRSAEYSDDCHDRSACSYPSTCSSLSKEQVLSPRLSFSVQSTESSHEWPSHLVGSHTRSSWQNPVVSNLGLDHHSHSDIRDEHSTTQCGLSSVLHILPPLRRNQPKQWVTYNSTRTIYGTRSIDNTHTHLYTSRTEIYAVWLISPYLLWHTLLVRKLSTLSLRAPWALNWAILASLYITQVLS